MSQGWSLSPVLYGVRLLFWSIACGAALIAWSGVALADSDPQDPAPRDGAVAVVRIEETVGRAVMIVDRDGDLIEWIGFGDTPRWSFDGRYLAYELPDNRLAIVEPPGSEPVGIIDVIVERDQRRIWRWDSDSATIFIDRGPEFRAYGVDGSLLVEIVATGKYGWWSPAGDRVSFWDETPVETGFSCDEVVCSGAIADEDGGVTRFDLNTGSAWSPDGTQLYASRSSDDDIGVFELWRLNPYTFDKVLVGEGLHAREVSPDGQWLLVSERAVDGELLGTTFHVVATQSFAVSGTVTVWRWPAGSASWSPSSEMFLVEGGNTIDVYDLGGSPLFTLDGYGASWSPSSASVAYWDVGLIEVDVETPSVHRLISSDPALERDFSWQPLVLTDVSQSTFVDDIHWLWDRSITRGCNPPYLNRYCPDSAVTRGQMAAFLTRALDLPPTDTDAFVDDDDSVFENDINRMAAAGITKGCNPPTNDAFCPERKVTREQMAAFLVRAFSYTDDGDGDLFSDDDPSIFEGDIDKLATAGVTKGCDPPDNDRFCPTENVTRGQMAAFLHRALG